MTGIDLPTAEFLTDLLPKIEDLGQAVTEADGIHVTRIEVADGDTVIGNIVYEDGTWVFLPAGAEGGSDDADEGDAEADETDGGHEDTQEDDLEDEDDEDPATEGEAEDVADEEEADDEEAFER